MRYRSINGYTKKGNTKYVCSTHKHILNERLQPVFKIHRRCIDCLKHNVYAHAGRYQIIVDNYSYLFPTLCDSCSSKMKVCKWCRPPIHNRILSYYPIRDNISTCILE